MEQVLRSSALRSKPLLENVGLLTREIFRVEFTESGYHALISDVVSRSNTFDQALAAFEGHLGAEGRALVRALWEER